jgi:hypothetical protein
MKRPFVSILICLLSIAELLAQNSSLLFFENFEEKNVFIPEKFKIATNDLYVFSTNSFNMDSFLNPPTEKKIDRKISEFLCQLEIINQWNRYKKFSSDPCYRDQKLYVEKKNKEIEIYLLGAISLNEKVDSYLIFVKDYEPDIYITNRRVYLLNIQGRRLKSIAKIADLSCSEGFCTLMYTELLNRNALLMKWKILTSDAVYDDGTEEENNNKKSEQILTTLFVDKKGFLREGIINRK